MHKSSSIIWPSFIIIGHTQTTQTTKPLAQVQMVAWLKIDMFTLILTVVHNIGNSCTKPSLIGLFSRVHNSDETQLTHLKFCTHVNKHFVNNVCKNNFITSYCFWMLPNMREYTFLGTPGMYSILTILGYDDVWKMILYSYANTPIKFAWL